MLVTFEQNRMIRNAQNLARIEKKKIINHFEKVSDAILEEFSVT